MLLLVNAVVEAKLGVDVVPNKLEVVLLLLLLAENKLAETTEVVPKIFCDVDGVFEEKILLDGFVPNVLFAEDTVVIVLLLFGLLPNTGGFPVVWLNGCEMLDFPNISLEGLELTKPESWFDVVVEEGLIAKVEFKLGVCPKMTGLFEVEPNIGVVVEVDWKIGGLFALELEVVVKELFPENVLIWPKTGVVWNEDVVLVDVVSKAVGVTKVFAVVVAVVENKLLFEVDIDSEDFVVSIVIVLFMLFSSVFELPNGEFAFVRDDEPNSDGVLVFDWVVEIVVVDGNNDFELSFLNEKPPFPDIGFGFESEELSSLKVKTPSPEIKFCLTSEELTFLNTKVSFPDIWFCLASDDKEPKTWLVEKAPVPDVWFSLASEDKEPKIGVFEEVVIVVDEVVFVVDEVVIVDFDAEKENRKEK